MLPFLYYSIMCYIGYKVIKPTILPITMYIYNSTVSSDTSYLPKFNFQELNKDSVVYLFERHFNFLKIEINESFVSQEICDFIHIELSVSNKCVIGNYSILLEPQESINKNLIDYLIIKCDKQILFKHIVYVKFFQISGMSVKQFNILYDKYNYLVINLRDNSLFYLDGQNL